MQSKRQKQVARTLQKAMSEIFQSFSSQLFGNTLVTITDVMVTRDLLIAKFYVSVLDSKRQEEIMTIISDNNVAIRKQLATIIRHSFKRVPAVEFYSDTTLDEVFKMEKLFDELKKDDHSEDSSSTPSSEE